MRRVAVFLCVFAPALAQDDLLFRAGVALVHVDAEVTLDGRTLTGFGKDDFRVLDERQERAILHFSAEEQALDLILLFDISGSMRMAVQGVAVAARQGLKELRQGDRVCVMVFNSRSREIAPFTGDLDAVERSIRSDVLEQRFGGGTLIQSAVEAAALRLMREPKSERRRAVLVITDNIGIRTRRELSVVRTFWEADALLSGLIISSKAIQAVQAARIVLGPQNLLLQAGMKGIAGKTGGDAIRAGDPGAAFTEAMHRIRSRYSLYYAQPEAKAGSMRSIRVSLAEEASRKFPKARVRARTGYAVPGKPKD